MKTVTLLALLLICMPALSQDQRLFNDIEADDELQDISSLLGNAEVDAEALNSARTQLNGIASAAAVCAEANSIARLRLEERIAPLLELAPEGASPESLAQRQSIGNALDDSIARQARCEGLFDDAQTLRSRVSERQNQLSQQFLSGRTLSVIDLLRDVPERIQVAPQLIRGHFELNLVEGVTTSDLFWYLAVGGISAALFGLFIRRRFSRWYESAGGDGAPPQMKYLFPKPLAEFAPLWLEGAVLSAILVLALADSPSSMVVTRIALAVFAFGLARVVIYWSTGPLSPAAAVKGLIPDHVAPLRLRLQILVFALCLSYVVLGNEWLSTRASETYVAGRALMILVISFGLIAVLTYLRKVSFLQRRFSLLRLAAVVATGLAVVAMLAGYHNFSGYLIQGIVRTGIAVFLLWSFLWLFFVGFNYLLEDKTPTASRVRTTLGISGTGSGTGIGFMQLVVDLILWIGLLVYLIYIWDNTGSTLGKFRMSIVEGWNIGGVSLIPMNIIGGILVFAVLIVIIGWIKRWMDRRWLQRIVIERGARDAILTLFGYVAFILTILISLSAASVDLTGLAIVSGALALGLGFGLQGIANNFVSGLILLFERPIKAGDFVSVGDVEGYVRSIRIRATEIETLDNQNVLVPNSELVSGRVTNWVLRDTHGRLQIDVGVAYGSDVEKVRDIMESIGRDHPEVITDGRAPAPRALFMGFGESSLNFELRVRVQRIERRFSVKSDINFSIDQAFRDAGITIPFPQRDLHIVSYPEQSKTEPKPVQSSSELTLPVEEITRSHSAELESLCDRTAIWAAITDIEQLKHWLVRDGEFAPNIGGLLNLSTRDGYSVSGRIDVFIPRRRMRIVLVPEKQEGPMPTGPITIELVLSESNATSKLSVTVAGIPCSEDWEEYYRLSVDRWRTALSELKSDVLGK
jgi:potassium efflux system protein